MGWMWRYLLRTILSNILHINVHTNPPWRRFSGLCLQNHMRTPAGLRSNPSSEVSLLCLHHFASLSSPLSLSIKATTYTGGLQMTSACFSFSSDLNRSGEERNGAGDSFRRGRAGAGLSFGGGGRKCRRRERFLS